MLQTKPVRVSQIPSAVMLVDDEPGILKLITRILVRAGHRVFACAGFEEAKDLLDKGIQPDVLVTDVVLRNSTGKRVADVVLQAWPRTKVIFISGYGNITVGGHPVLQKPFKHDELIELIDQVLIDTSGAVIAPRRKH